MVKNTRPFFPPVNGAGGSVWPLMIDDYFRGQLMLHGACWRFGSNATFEEVSRYFSDYVLL